MDSGPDHAPGTTCTSVDNQESKRVIVGKTENATSLQVEALPTHGMCIFFMRGIDCSALRIGCMGLHVPKSERPPCQDFVATGLCARGTTCWFPHVFPKSDGMMGDLVLQVSASHADRTRDYILQAYGPEHLPEHLLESDTLDSQQGQWQTRRHDKLLFLRTSSSEARLALIELLGSDPIAPATMSRYYPVEAVFSAPLDARAYMSERIQSIMRLIPSRVETAEGALPNVSVRIQAFPPFVAPDVAMLLGAALVKVAEPPPGEPDGDFGPRPCIMPDFREAILAGGTPESGILPQLPFTVCLKRHEFDVMVHAVVASNRMHLSLWRGNECIPWGHMAMKRSLSAPIADARCRAFFKLVEIQQRSKVFPNALNEAATVAIDVGASPGGWSQYLATVQKLQQVFAIDPAELPSDPPLPAAVKHMKMKAQEAFPQLLDDGLANQVGVYVCDANISIDTCFQVFEQAYPLLRKGCIIVITLKHFIGPIKKMKVNVNIFMENMCKLAGLALTDLQLTHLLANGAAEVTLTATLPS